MVVLALKLYAVFVVVVMSIYAIRHWLFTVNRLRGEQRLAYQDILDEDLPSISVLIPMHNEERVAANILEQIEKADYPREKLEIIPINDHSTDKTREIVDSFVARNPELFHPIHREEGQRGKPAALNDALEQARGEVLVIFDADYLPPPAILKEIAAPFLDPQVGAVMGRVIPENVGQGLLTRLLDLERTAGYQIDQQARYNLHLLPQFGGTVGGFRRDRMVDVGGFDPAILTEDTDLTYRIFLRGWKIVYANRAECYEEVPQEWRVRARQVERWAYGHTQCLFRHFGALLRSRLLTFREKFDGLLLLLIYTVPIILLFAILVSLSLFFLGEMNLVNNIVLFVFVASYNSFGNFAPFYQIVSGALLDGSNRRILLVPFLFLNFLFNVWFISKGVMHATYGTIFHRTAEWKKTERFRKKEASW